MTRSLLLVSAAFVGAFVAQGAAAQPVTGPYVSLGAGVGLQQDETERVAPQQYQALVPVFDGGSSTSRREVFTHRAQRIPFAYDPGLAGQVSAGWGIGRGLRVELEGAYAFNHVSRPRTTSVPERAGGFQQRYGGFVNVLYDVDLHLPIYPYVGIGAGGEAVENNGPNNGAPDVPNGNRRRHVEGAFAYQAIVGASLPIRAVPGLSATLDYRFIGLLDPMAAYPVAELNGHGRPTGVSNGKLSNLYTHEITLGLRYAFGHRARATPGAALAASAPAPVAERTYLVFFDWDRAALSARARDIVAEAARASTRVRTTRLAVNGYTDSSGTVRYNQALSLRRARVVAAELVRDGVPSEAIAISGLGETQPLVPTAAGVREAQNRRVEILLQ